LDENFTFVVSKWSGGKSEGPWVAIFGDSTIIYGWTLEERDSLLVYMKGDCKMYRLGSSLVMDCLNIHTLVRLEVEEGSHHLQELEPKTKITAESKYSEQDYLAKLS
jgi:hypothetical protein